MRHPLRPPCGRNGYVCNRELCDCSRSVKVELTIRAHAGRGGIRGWDAMPPGLLAEPNNSSPWGCMKFVPVILSSLLFAAAQAAAQAPSECPSLPASSGLQWQQQVQADFLVCRASTADGREVLSLMLSARDPAIPLNRSLRQEKAASAVNRCTGTSPTWAASNRRVMPNGASAWSRSTKGVTRRLRCIRTARRSWAHCNSWRRA